MTESDQLDEPTGLGATDGGRAEAPGRKPRAFRIASRRVVASACVVAFSGWGLVVGGSKAWSRFESWVARQPDQQIALTEVELVPAPPGYIRGGASALLGSVRAEAKLDEAVSVPSFDTASFRRDFQRNPWVEGVSRVQKSYRKVALQVAYRRPVALVEIKGGKPMVIDRMSVELPAGEIVGQTRNRQYRARGLDYPLIEIFGVGLPEPDRKGLAWKPLEGTDARDDEVLRAARLADFLVEQFPNLSGPLAAIFKKPIRVWYSRDTDAYFLMLDGVHYVFWKQPPGFERPGELSAAEKWRSLSRYVAEHGSLDFPAGNDAYLSLKIDGADVVKFAR